MGKISDMQTNQNDINLSYVRNKSKQRKITKPRLKVRNAKDILTLLGPTSNKYRLSPNQRKFQLGGRLTIAALAAAMAIGTGVAYNSAKTQNPTVQEMTDINEELSKDDVLGHAEEKLLTFLYKDKLFFKDDAFIKYSHDSEINSDTISVYKQLKSPNAEPILEFSYTRFNNLSDKLMYPTKNSPEITQLLNSMLDIHFAENISQKDLENLNTDISKFDISKFELKENNIVGISETELGDER